MGFVMRSFLYCLVIWTMVRVVDVQGQGSRGQVNPALAKGWQGQESSSINENEIGAVTVTARTPLLAKGWQRQGQDSSSNNENEIGTVTVAARTPLAKGWQGQDSSRNNEIDTARTARTVTCARCIDSVCKSHFWDPESPWKSNCDVCYKRVVYTKNQYVYGHRYLVTTASIRRGCLSMEEVQARELTVGECSMDDVAGDEFTSHYQCLCNDRDLCNSSRSLKVNTDTIGLIFILCCLALIFN